MPARRARRHLEPWHAARGAGRFAAARVSLGAMASSPRETNVSAAGVSAGGDSSRETRDASPSPRVQRAATPMRGLTGKHHPSVNLPPLRLPRCAEGEDGFSKSGASGEDGFLVVGRDFNRARFDPVANSKFLDDRPWDAVDAFARDLVLGEACLTSLVDATCVHRPESARADARKDLFAFCPASPCDGEGVDPSGARLRDAPTGMRRRTHRHTYRFSVRYYGPGFAGWAWRAEDAKYFDDAPWSVGAFSAAAATQKALAPLFANDTNATRPLWCAGRTDKGVHGLAQTVSFTVADDLEKESRESEKKGGLGKPFRETVAALVAASPAGLLGHLRVVASPAPREAHRKFHATFCATWRRYVYVFPTRQSMREERTPRREIDVSLLNEMLGRLVRKEKKHPFDGGKAAVDGVDGIASTGSPGVDCYAFARDTVAGKDSRVVFRVARAFRGHVPRVDDDPHGTETRDSRGEEVIVIELVANRFLRKLVRVLVATAAREAATGAKPDVLLALAAARERSATASAAPPNGLFFAGVGYGDHPEYDEA